MIEIAPGLAIAWSPVYQPAWDACPAAYVACGAVSWGRSRRLARAQDASRHFKAYLGIQHFDPMRWHVAGEARTAYFLSLFLGGRTISLRTYATLAEALAALRSFHATLPPRPGESATTESATTEGHQ
ncbi:MAG: hypothetical protein IVW57_12805 [Ktedonobacterales bacterium]|nr:hypothetical protein [Ktedonobacterales bacterium]